MTSKVVIRKQSPRRGPRALVILGGETVTVFLLLLLRRPLGADRG